MLLEIFRRIRRMYSIGIITPIIIPKIMIIMALTMKNCLTGRIKV